MQGKTFQTIEDLHAAMKLVADFCDDAIYAMVFEFLFTGPNSDSNLFDADIFGSDDDRLRKVAKAIAPDLDDEPNLSAALTAACKTEADQERVFGLVRGTQKAFLTLGILWGARIGDRSNDAFENLAAGWIRSELAQPRHRHLATKTAQGRKNRFSAKSSS